MPVAHEKDMRYLEHQDDVALNQANPISGTQYAVLPLSTYVRLITGYIAVTWTVQPSPLEMHVTMNVVHTFAFIDPVSATPYFPAWAPAGAEPAQALVVGTAWDYRAFFAEHKTMSITAETTGGTVSNLTARIKWGRWI